MTLFLSVIDERLNEQFPLMPEVIVMYTDQIVTVNNNRRNGSLPEYYIPSLDLPVFAGSDHQ